MQTFSTVEDGAELVLQNDHVLALEAHDGVDLGTAVVELLQHGIRDGAADAAAHHADLLLALGLGGLAQGAHKVLKTVALLLVAELLGGSAHGLDDNGHSALLAVVVVDGDGDALADLVHTQDDELPRLRLLRHHGGLDLIEDHGGLQRFFSDDTVHTSRLLFLYFVAVCPPMVSVPAIVALLPQTVNYQLL